MDSLIYTTGRRTFQMRKALHTAARLSRSGNPKVVCMYCYFVQCRLLLKCDGTRAETRFRLSAKRTGPFTSVGASVQSTTGSRGVCIIGSNAGYTMFRGSVKSTGYPLHSPVSPSPPFPCVTVCHHILTGLYTLQCLVSSFSCK